MAWPQLQLTPLSPHTYSYENTKTIIAIGGGGSRRRIEQYLGSGYYVRRLDLVVESASSGLVNGHAPIVESKEPTFFFRSGCSEIHRIRSINK